LVALVIYGLNVTIRSVSIESRWGAIQPFTAAGRRGRWSTRTLVDGDDEYALVLLLEHRW